MKKLIDSWNKLDPFMKEKFGEVLALFILGVYATFVSVSHT